MYVPFTFECDIHGQFEYWFHTDEFPDRNFPDEIRCKWADNNSLFGGLPDNHMGKKLLNTRGMQPDSYWAGKEIKSLGITVNSKSYLKRYCKTEGIQQLTDEEVKTTKHKTKTEIVKEQLARPEVRRERERIISESIDGFGVIDSVNMEK